MADTEMVNMALTFDEYLKLIEKFGKVETFSSETVKLDDILQEAEITEDTKEKYLSAFKILLKHIHDDGLFYSGNNQEACKYINYLLYKEVQHEIKRSYDKELISIFHKFLKAYGKKHGMQNRCISNIYSIEDQTYNNINALYEVYDKYKECYLFKEQTIHLGCDRFENFFASYDKYMRETQSKSLEFNKILENIAQYAKNAVSLYKKKCYIYSSVPRSPRLFIPPPVKKPEIHKEAQMGQAELKLVDSMSHYATHGITNIPQTKLSNGITISQTEHYNERRDEENSETVDHSANDVHIANYSHRGSPRQEITDPHIKANEEQTHRLSRFQTTIRPSYPPGTSLYSGEYGHVGEQYFTNEVELSPSSFMNTITSTLKNVDPVPVVGVSGGMGALFLLFRYTPVGTFFRGRGYRQRIPTRFDGVHPGFMTEFQGYGDGYFPHDRINITYGPE